MLQLDKAGQAIPSFRQIGEQKWLWMTEEPLLKK